LGLSNGRSGHGAGSRLGAQSVLEKTNSWYNLNPKTLYKPLWPWNGWRQKSEQMIRMNEEDWVPAISIFTRQFFMDHSSLCHSDDPSRRQVFRSLGLLVRFGPSQNERN
jgi:hypothetical protein